MKGFIPNFSTTGEAPERLLAEWARRLTSNGIILDEELERLKTTLVEVNQTLAEVNQELNELAQRIAALEQKGGV